MTWFSVNFCKPHAGKVVLTKVVDEYGTRNVQELFLRGSLWFIPDGSMYVYYTPTHWRYL